MNRFLEMLIGILSWGTLLGLLFLSWKVPFAVAIFIVLYDLFWFLKTVYLFFHLRYSFSRMKKNIATNWVEKLNEEKHSWEHIRHLIVLPIYKESYDVIRETIISFTEINYPTEKIFILLAPEERGGMKDGAEKVREEFKEKFGGFSVIEHPAGIPGELPGKGSNETYAVKKAISELVIPSGIPIEHFLVSVFDIDTRPGKEYLGVLTHSYCVAPHPDRSSYQPIPVFTSNIYKVPIFARLIGFSSTFWQLMQQARPEQLVTFSSHSMPLKALQEIGFWHTDIVSEDSRIFFQCFEHYKGDWRVVPLLYPVYMDLVEGETIFQAMKNLYKQQRRWAWGIENIPYVLKNFWRSKTVSFRKKIFWTFTLLDGFHSWATSSFIIFLFGFLPNVFGGALFHQTVTSYNLPKITGFIINLSTFGIITSAFLSVRLLPAKDNKKHKWYEVLYYLAQWFLIPITFIFFSAIPALEAQTRMMLGGKFKLGFWVTPKGIAQKK